MPTYRVQHAFQGISLQPEDQYVNVLHFFAVSPIPGGGGALAAAVKGFYANAPTGGSGSVASRMSGISDAPGASVKIYNLSDAIPRAVVYEEFYDPAAHGTSGTSNLPSECAVCLSYEALPASGLPQARRRGRMYIGPLANNAVQSGGVGVEAAVDNSFRNDIVQAALEMAAIANTAGFDWMVYSPTDSASVSVSRVWVDNAFDTQRRRGNRPTTRTTGTVGT